METAASIHPLLRTRASCPQCAGLSPITLGGPGPHLDLARVQPDPLPSVDITWSLGGGRPTHLPSLLSCSCNGRGGPDPRCAAGCLGVPTLLIPVLASWPPTLPWPPRGFPYPSSTARAYAVLLIPGFRQSPAPPPDTLPPGLAEPGVFTAPPTPPLKSPPLFPLVTKSRCEASPGIDRGGREPKRPGLQHFLL